jgi:hypothetical protein
VRAAVLEGKAGACDEVLDRAGDEHLTWGGERTGMSLEQRLGRCALRCKRRSAHYSIDAPAIRDAFELVLTGVFEDQS